MEVRAENRGRPHQKVRFPATPLVGSNFVTPGHPGVRVRDARGKSGPKSLCYALRSERPFTGVSGPSGAKIAKKSQKESYWGSAKKSPRKYPKVQKTQLWTFSAIFGDFFADPQKDSFCDFFAILAPEGPETPVNGRSNLNLRCFFFPDFWGSGPKGPGRLRRE